MGVWHCRRKGCWSIMPDRYSDEYGYICGSCFNELVSSGIDTDIEEFMLTDKNTPSKTIDSNDYFDIIFPDRSGE